MDSTLLLTITVGFYDGPGYLITSDGSALSGQGVSKVPD